MAFSPLYFIKNPFRLVTSLLSRLPHFRFLRDTHDYQNKVNFSFWFNQKILNIGNNKSAYWPVHYTSQVYDAHNILVGVDAYPGIMKGCYIQGKGGIVIGDYTQVAPNVIIVSSNHDLYDNRKALEKKVAIGKYCWIGAGAKIMPGVILGDWTIVGAGSVVTKSFEDGHCIIGGVPAKIIKTLDSEKCIPFSNEKLYNGYISNNKFEQYRKKHLTI